jgi:hypothetical protein
MPEDRNDPTFVLPNGGRANCFYLAALQQVYSSDFPPTPAGADAFRVAFRHYIMQAVTNHNHAHHGLAVVSLSVRGGNLPGLIAGLDVVGDRMGGQALWGGEQYIDFLANFLQWDVEIRASARDGGIISSETDYGRQITMQYGGNHFEALVREVLICRCKLYLTTCYTIRILLAF